MKRASFDFFRIFELRSKIGCISEIQRKTSFSLVFRSICTIFAARMRQIYGLLIVLLALAGCGGGRYGEMRQRLEALNALNRADSVLTATERDEAQTLANYFDSHGTSNDQMLAHYLLGRCYADMREAPMALHCYQEAISRADTTAKDCDFAQLSRVYGQSATIFYQQGLYRNQLEYLNLSVKYGWISKDTLNALLSYAKKSSGYDHLQHRDSAILNYENAIKQLNAYKYNKVAAGFSGTLAKKLIDKGETSGALPYLQDYEHHSGYFDFEGNIAKGREIYYYWKGLYYLKTNQLDSAEYYFRKELRTGKDFNNQNCGSHGLALLFRQKHKPDSAAKYFSYSYDMNDSCFVQMTTHEVEQSKAMYDYSRHQEIAQQEKGKAESRTMMFLVSVLVSLILLLIAGIVGFLYYVQRKRSQAEALRFQELKANYVKALEDVQRLESHDVSLLDSKRQEVEQLQQQLLRYKVRLQAISLSSGVKELQEKERIVEAFRSIVMGKASINEPEERHWQQLDEAFARHLPLTFSVLGMKNLLSTRERQVCMLTLLGFTNGEMGTLLNVSTQRISNIKKEANQKLFNSPDASTLERNLATLEQNV